jgi:hypothetical protein
VNSKVAVATNKQRIVLRMETAKGGIFQLHIVVKNEEVVPSLTAGWQVLITEDATIVHKL